MEFDAVEKRIRAAAPADTEVLKVELVEEGTPQIIPGITARPVPEHIRIEAVCRPEPGSNIRIEVWLPTVNWNGDLYGVGNGGYAGIILPFLLMGPVRMNFAVATTDMGTSAGPDCGIGNKAVWKDFGYRATHVMTIAAKAFIEGYYGTPVKHAYFNGGSTGGQQALMEAQRYPEDYDGILAVAPAHDRTNLHLGFLWDWQALQEIHFTQEDQARITNAILEHCGEAGGRHPGDNFMYHPDKITVTEDVLQAAGLADRQIKALMKIYHGVCDPVSGEFIYEPTLMPGSETGGISLASRCARPDFERDYLYIFRWVLGEGYDFTQFDFHTDRLRVCRELDSYLNATQTDLRAFKERGGKLLLIHGTADPIIPYTSSVRYYKQVQENMGNVDDFFRLFLVPGMEHTSGGPGLQDIATGFAATPKDSKHNGVLALKEWVENGNAPDVLCPVAFKDNNLMNGFREDGYGYEREIYPY